MITSMLNIHELKTSVLIVVIEPENLERMKKGDPATLESISQGGILPPPLYPLNLGTLIAYETDTAELYIKAQGNTLDFLRWLERGRVFIKGKDGTENSRVIRRGDVGQGYGVDDLNHLYNREGNDGEGSSGAASS